MVVEQATLPDLGNFLEAYFPWASDCGDENLTPPLRDLVPPPAWHEPVRRIREAKARLEFETARKTAYQLGTADSTDAQLLADITVGWCEVALGHTAAAENTLKRAITRSPYPTVRAFLHELRTINFLCVGRYEAARETLAATSAGLGPHYTQPLYALLEVACGHAARGSTLSCPDWMVPAQSAARYSPFIHRFFGYCDPHLAQLSVQVNGLDIPVLSVDNVLLSIKHKAVTSAYVFRRDLHFGTVVIKLIIGYCGYNVGLESREYQFLKRIDSDSVPKAYAEIRLSRVYIIVTELLSGEPLLPGKFFERMDPQICELIPSEDRWQEVLATLRRQLKEVAKHCLYHGDVSPDNILVTSSGVSLIDLGLAIETDSIEEANALHERALRTLNTYMLNTFRETCPTWKKEHDRRALVAEAHVEKNAMLARCIEKGDYSEFRRKIDAWYDSEQQQFGLTKYYQSFRHIGIVDAFRNSEQRFDFYAIYKLLRKSDSVLDIGSNTGFLSIMHAPFAARIHGIEHSASLIEIATETAAFLNVPNCTFSRCSFENFRTSERFDVILDLAAHGWVRLDFASFFAEVDRLLNERGLFIIESHNLRNSDADFDQKVAHVQDHGFQLLRYELVPDTGDDVPRRFCVFVRGEAS